MKVVCKGTTRNYFPGLSNCRREDNSMVLYRFLGLLRIFKVLDYLESGVSGVGSSK